MSAHPKALFVTSAAFLVFSTIQSIAGCTAYMDENLKGDKIAVAQNEVDLTRHKRLGIGDWNDEISSIQVNSGICRVFEHTEFRGAYRDLRKGVYPNAAAIGLRDNSISSIEVRDAP